MVNYDFSTLNPTDFEKLVCDLLNKKVKGNNYAKYRTSKEGKDKGIDILFSTSKNDFQIVGQVKHYVKSTFSKLRSDLIKIELEKVKKLNPAQYIFVTSLPLSVANKQEIKIIFSPYIASLQDILGKDDINGLLALHKDVEEAHFKLWFSSTLAIQKLLNYRFIGRNDEFSEIEVSRKLRLFVSTAELEKAKWIMENNKFLIITGEPGVGKTTLSEILIYRYLAKDFELTYIYDDIKDVEHALKSDDSKQIFYFDDFLGHTEAEINRSKAAEISLLKIISRIEKAENKYLILNTRKFILSTFLEESERFKNFDPLRAESKIELQAYSFGAKRRMLDNHIFECKLDAKQIQVLKELSFFICTHKNFSPRHIDFYTSVLHVGHFGPKELRKFIIDNLVNPEKIWKHAYVHQISDYDKLLLNTLYSLGGRAKIEILERAYNKRLNYEVKEGNYVKPLNSFKECLQKLNGGFIDVNTNRSFGYVTFINPSLEDFLHYWIEENELEVERILFSAINLEQWYYFFKPFHKSKYVITPSLNDFLKSNYSSYLQKQQSDIDLYKIAMLLFEFDADENEAAIFGVLQRIKSWQFIAEDNDINSFSFKFLQVAKSHRQINHIISCAKLEFFLNSLLSTARISELMEIVLLFRNHYGFDFIATFRSREDDTKFIGKVAELKKLCKRFVKDEIDSLYNFLLNNKEIDAHIDEIEGIRALKQFVRSYLFPKFKIKLFLLTERDWNGLIEINAANQLVFGESVETNYDEDAEAYYERYHAYEEYDEYYDYSSEESASLWSNEFREYEHDDLPF